MSTPVQGIEVLHDTMNWIDTDSDLSAYIPAAKRI